MTMVISMMPKGLPLMVGDLLLSAPTSDDTIHLPTLGETTIRAPKLIIAPLTLAQKICLLGPDLVIGWSGKHDEARKVLTSLWKAHQSRGFRSVDELNEHGKDFEAPSLQLVGFLRSPLHGGVIWPFHIGAEECEIQAFGLVHRIGSGSEDALVHLLRLQSNPWQVWPGFESDDPRAFASTSALAAACSLVSTGLMKEIVDPNSLIRRLYGGGFETAFWQEGGFAKLSNVSFLFWRIGAIPDGVGLTPFLLLRQRYLEDVLLLSAYDSQPMGTYLEVTRRSGYVVPPIYRDGPEMTAAAALELERAPSSVFCNLLWNQDLRECNCIVTSDPSGRWIKEEFSDDGFILSWEGSFLKNLLDSALASVST